MIMNDEDKINSGEPISIEGDPEPTVSPTQPDLCNSLTIEVTAEGWFVEGIRRDGEQESHEFGTLGGAIDFIVRKIANPERR